MTKGAPPSGPPRVEPCPSGHPLAIVIPTYRRPLRLRWLLNALAEQDGPFEVLVGYDAADTETAHVLATHPLRPRAVPVANRLQVVKRNAAWRASKADLIVFTDDDCRPPPGWLAAIAASARRHPGAIVQGATHPDPDELGVFQRAPHARSQQIDPVHPMGQTCNIAYPRALLEALGGFDESLPEPAGEDTDLFLRAQRAGALVVAAPEALTYHAVEWGLRTRVRGVWRWGGLALTVRRNPELRRLLPAGGWAWKAEHVRWCLAVLGLVARRPWLALPWVLGTSRRYGTHPRALARTAAELPGRFAVDGIETLAMARGSLRHRSLLL
jgi:glycosyltransferase involved in cell wall biosynthesis